MEKYRVKTLIDKYSTPSSLKSSLRNTSIKIPNTAPKVKNFISQDLQDKMTSSPIMKEMYNDTFEEPIGDFAKRYSRNINNEYLFPNELVTHSKTIAGYNDKTSKLERVFGAPYSSDKLSNELIKIAQKSRNNPSTSATKDLGFEYSIYNKDEIPNVALAKKQKSIVKKLEEDWNLKPNNYYNFNLRPLFALPIIATTATKIKSSDQGKIKPTKFGGYERLTKR